MKITNIRTEIVNVSQYSNWIFVIVDTDSNETGYGEATLDGFEFEVAEMVKNISSGLIGKNVLSDNFSIQNKSGAMISAAACSAIDMAMWDLKGKALGVPVYKLLGGAVRTEIPVYVSFNRAIADRSPEGFAKFAKELVAKGNTGLKCAPFDDYTWRNPLSKSEALERGIERFAAIRDAVGFHIEIAVDAHWRFDFSTAMDVAARLKPLKPFWYEAPLPEHKPELIGKLRQECGIRIAGSEMQCHLEDHLPLLNNQCLDVYMPDVRYVGGITGILKLAALLETYDELISPHNMSGPIATAASLHAAATMKNLINVEYHADESERIPELSDKQFIVKNGCFEIPQSPGLGINLCEDALKRYPYKKAVPLRKNMLGG